MREALPDEAVVLCDMCIPGYWLAGFHRVPAPRRLAYPMGWGTLGFAFPASLGAALAGGGPVVSVSGDGGFLFACGELAAVAQEELPVTTVIVDDGGYGMLRFDQRRTGQASFGVDLHAPTSPRSPSPSACAPRRWTAWARTSGRRSRGTSRPAEPTVLVARAALEPPPTTSPRWYRRH